jgi:hypothetical protein
MSCSVYNLISVKVIQFKERIIPDLNTDLSLGQASFIVTVCLYKSLCGFAAISQGRSCDMIMLNKTKLG